MVILFGASSVSDFIPVCAMFCLLSALGQGVNEVSSLHVIRVHPQGGVVDQDGTLTLRCAANNSNLPFMFTYNEELISENDPKRTIASNDLTQESYLTLHNFVTGLEGEYVCLARNRVGNITFTVASAPAFVQLRGMCTSYFANGALPRHNSLPVLPKHDRSTPYRTWRNSLPVLPEHDRSTPYRIHFTGTWRNSLPVLPKHYWSTPHRMWHNSLPVLPEQDRSTPYRIRFTGTWRNSLPVLPEHNRSTPYRTWRNSLPVYIVIAWHDRSTPYRTKGKHKPY